MSPLPELHLRVLGLLAEHLKDLPHLWALTGSTSLALQGLPLTPHDIDLQTTKAGAFAMARRLQPWVVQAPFFRRSRHTRSYWGLLRIRDLRVEMMGDIQHRRPDGGWYPVPDLSAHIVYVDIGDLHLPVLRLSYEARAYRRMGREQRAGEIERWLASLSASAHVDQT
ncbi:MAG: hypothetical protein D6775_12045 [Caldilineae bacterium]|nr:MAG: hypothetical protein D6775_12045 [Caldilineae bacterium]